MKNFSKVLACALVTVFAVLCLVACAPNSNPDKAVEALENKGYIVVATKGAALSFIELGGCEHGDVSAFVTATKVNEDKTLETVTIVYFKDASTCKDKWESVKSYLVKKDGEKAEDSDYTVERSGKMIYAGTEAAIKAAR